MSRMKGRDVLQRIQPLVQNHVIDKPLWYNAVSARPPVMWLKKAKPPRLVFPEDRLIRNYEKRNPESKDEVLKMIGGQVETVGMKFVQEQLELMGKGMSEDDAYLEVKQKRDAEKEETEKDVEGLKEAGAVPSKNVVARLQQKESAFIKKAMRQELHDARKRFEEARARIQKNVDDAEEEVDDGDEFDGRR